VKTGIVFGFENRSIAKPFFMNMAYDGLEDGPGVSISSIGYYFLFQYDNDEKDNKKSKYFNRENKQISREEWM
jgi:hypothetical protein